MSALRVDKVFDYQIGGACDILGSYLRFMAKKRRREKGRGKGGGWKDEEGCAGCDEAGD